MSPMLILAVIVLVPIVLAQLLRVNTAVVFLSLCLGDVLVQFVGEDANFFLSAVSNRATPDTIKLGLLLLPAILTLVFMARTVKKSLLVLNAIPAIGAGLLTALLVVPLLPAGAMDAVTGSSAWQEIQKAQDMIVGLGALVSLFFLWLQRPKAHEAKHGKSH